MQNKWKKSLFTHVIQYNNKIILYNTITQKKFISQNVEDVNRILSGENTLNTHLFEQMRKLDFIVPSEYDEKSKAQLLYYDQIFDKNLTITLLVTEQCNFRCLYCYESFERGKMTESTINGIIAYLKRNLPFYSGLVINWFGGEPLLAADVVEKLSIQIIQLCKKLHKPYSATMTTNGYLLSSDRMEKLLKLRILQYQVTLDGSKELHNKYRPLVNGEPTFDSILENLLSIHNEIRSSCLSILLRINVTKESFLSLRQFIDYLYSKFGSDQRFKLLLCPVGDLGGERVHKISSEVLEDSATFYSVLSSYKCYSDFILNLQDKMFREGVCYAKKRNSYVIGSDGTVYKCTVYLGEDVNRIGYIQENGTLNLDYEKLAKWVFPDVHQNQCESCSFSQYCMGGQCPAKAILSKRSFSMFCGCEKSLLDYFLELSSDIKDF